VSGWCDWVIETKVTIEEKVRYTRILEFSEIGDLMILTRILSVFEGFWWFLVFLKNFNDIEGF